MRLVFCAVAAVLLCNSAGARPVSRQEKREVDVRPVETRQALDCTSAIPVRIGDLVAGDNTGAPANVSAYSCDSWNESGGEVVFELTIVEPGCHTVGVSLGYDEAACDLDLWVLGSCDEDDCLYYDDHGEFLDCLDPGTYYVVVDGYEGDECPFTLTIMERVVPADCCPLLSVCHEFDFNASDAGFSTMPCGGASVWEWGTSILDPTVDCDDGTVTNVLGTVLDGDTPDYAGEAALLGPVPITPECSCMELCHYYCIEDSYDGGSVKVSTDGGSTWDLVIPASYYDGRDEFIALDNACVRGELAYSHEDQPFQFRTDSFDLSGYSGEELLIGLFFGSDESSGDEGWYVSSIRLGSSGTPVERRSWGTIKALYR